MIEAMLYEKLPNQGVQCHVCHHRCVIQPGHRGICAVRENQNGILMAINYGLTISAAIDSIEKKPLYHFLPGSNIYSFATVGCNMRCSWCQNFEISQHPKPNKRILGTPITPEEHIKRAIDSKCPSIAYTYSEPTIFVEYALETMKLAKASGLKNVWVTNGFMTLETLEAITPYLDAANVDFKGPDDLVYQPYCGAFTQPIMDNLVYLYQKGVHLEITTLVIPGVNDKPEQIKAIATFIARKLSPQVPWHLSRFFPAWKLFSTPITPYKTLLMAQTIGQEAGLLNIHLGNV